MTRIFIHVSSRTTRAGIYLQYSTNTPPLVPGQIIEITGTSSPGEYAPILVPEQVHVVGQAALPVPKVVTYEQLASGMEDSQFVEISGVVRSVQLQEASQHYLIEMRPAAGGSLVYVRQLPVMPAEDLLDSTVRVRGVCSTAFNHQRQLFAIRLMGPRPEDFVVELPAPGGSVRHSGAPHRQPVAVCPARGLRSSGESDRYRHLL
ncbi:MAG: hypothetical protein WDN00_15015 [Limisphaerales bacterium]